MSILKFSDGMSVRTGENIKIVKRPDGLHVVGENLRCPVGSREDGKALIDLMSRVLKKQDELLLESGLTQGEVQNDSK